MKNIKKVKQWIIFAITIACMLMCTGIIVNASSVQENSNMDVVLVIDVSGSMKQADPGKVALEGAKLFIDMMESKGSRAGIVAFSDKMVQITGLTELQTDSDKTALKTTIDNLNFSGDTDIGSALQKAMEILNVAQDIGNKKMVLFFTDGKIDLPKGAPSEAAAETASLQATETAVASAASAGIPIYTIGLNTTGGVDTDLISRISSSTGVQTNIVNDAGELPTIYNDIFADFVETEINELGNIKITSADQYEELPFNIPNDSVLEANIVMITTNTGTINDILLVKPDGNTLVPDGKNVFLSTSNNYNMLKLIAPGTGDWILKIKGDQGCEVHVNLLFNYDITLKAVSQPDADGNLELSATLEKKGMPVSDPALYSQLTTVANVSRNDGTVTSYPMSLSDTTFTCTVPVAEGEKISVTVHTEGANMYRDSDLIEYENNSKPAAPAAVQKMALPSPIELKGFLPSLAKAKLDLADYFEMDDGSKLVGKYNAQIKDQGIASADIKDSELELKGKSKGKTEIEVQAEDDQGNILTQQTELIVVPLLGSIIPIIIGLIVIILLVIILVIILVTKKGPMSGYLYWQILEEDGFSSRNGTGEEQFDLTFAKKKALVSNFVTEFELAYAGLEKVEITAAKNGLNVQNKGKNCKLMDENGSESKKIRIFDGGSFRILCQTEDGNTVFVAVRYQKDLNEFY